MEKIYEVACYVQKLQSILKEDDSFFGITIEDKKARIQMKREAFFSTFTQYEITYRKRLELYWFAEKIVDVEFFTVVSEDGIKELESTMPDQWKLIDSKLNEEDFDFEDDTEEK